MITNKMGSLAARKIKFSILTTLLAFTALIAAAVTDAQAQKWPEKPVRIVTPFAPGGGTDVFARILAQRFSEVFGQQFFVDNRPGAGSTTGTEFVARAPADGYTFLMTSASFSFNPGLYPKLRYDSMKDFAPVSQVVAVAYMLHRSTTDVPRKLAAGSHQACEVQSRDKFLYSSGRSG
jgi:tripartite-type tricarboxylate transporter receptor subunit TctC